MALGCLVSGPYLWRAISLASLLLGQLAFSPLLAVAHTLAICIPGTQESLFFLAELQESSIFKYIVTFILITTVTVTLTPSACNCC